MVLKNDSISEIELGNKLSNPYTIDNMLAAYQNLTVKGIHSKVEPNIRITHYYIKISPNSMDEYTLLKENNQLNLYDFPLDYEVLSEGNKYHDKSLADSIPTYQYTVVKDKNIIPASVSYEVLSELYIPEEDTSLLKSDLSNSDFVSKLLDQAYIQTNNFQDTVKANSGSYNPQGYILINDTRLNTYIGLEGVEVHARRWFTTLKAKPNFNGYYIMKGTFKRPCNYSLYFIANHFTIREHLLGLTYWINGPKTSGAWNHVIHRGYDRFVGHIFRGAYRYHYQDIAGLQRPYRPSGNKTTYIAKDSKKDWSGVNWIVFPVIKIARYNSNSSEYASDEIYSTTIHETAHTSHVIIMNAGAIQYSQVSSLIQESWPIAVEWWLTKLEYKNARGVLNYGDWNYNVDIQYPHRYAYQYWNKTISSDYSTLFINLTEDHNELNQYYPPKGMGTVDDQIVGYTFPIIEQKILKHSYGNTSLTTQLKNNKPISVTDDQIDILMRYY